MDDTYGHYSRVVENYDRYRPRYPRALLAWLGAECGLAPGQRVADIGSGTGQLAELLAGHGCQVAAVEPNGDMRRAAERALGGSPLFSSVDGAAEATGLGDASVDLITVGNAFHWFDHELTRREFARILKPGGWVALAWNLERKGDSAFAAGLERIWREHIDPAARFGGLAERKLPGYIAAFFGAGGSKQAALANPLACDFDALKGLALSTIKSPPPGDPRHAALLGELRALFDQFQLDGVVTVEFDTAVIAGRLAD